jgi:polyhydroxybutyrate depolymerase
MNRLTLFLACLLLAAAACGDDADGGGSDATVSADSGVDTDAGADTGVTGDGGVNGGCGQDPTTIATTLDVGGQLRSFVVWVPDDYDPNHTYPLIFAWHGLGGDGQLAQNYFGIQQLVGSTAILVYPDALPLPGYNGQTGWELSPAGYDFDFFDALYDHLVDNLCINASRVFSTGHSFGGYMTNSLGCHRASVLRAIAPVAGGPPYYGACEGAIAAWLTHGTADDVVLLAEGEAARDTWLGTNGCEATSTSTSPDPCITYDGCSQAVHWCQHSGGHEWPALAAAAINAFFEAQ